MPAGAAAETRANRPGVLGWRGATSEDAVTDSRMTDSRLRQAARGAAAALLALAGAAVLLPAGAARAENWVDTRHTTEVDVDSIRSESDGLT